MNSTMDLDLDTLDTLETPGDTSWGVAAGLAFVGGVVVGVGIGVLLT